MFLKKRASRYRLKLFAGGFLCIWAIIGSFAWLQYNRDHYSKKREIKERVDFAAERIVDFWNQDNRGLINLYLDFLSRYYEDNILGGLSLSVYDLSNGELINSVGAINSESPLGFEKAKIDSLSDGSTAILLDDAHFPSGEKIFYYYSRVSPERGLEVRAYLPYTQELDDYLSAGDLLLCIMVSIIGTIGTLVVYFITSHQAKNISLLHEFAQRAANDRDFIPMGEFPPDELGDISRQIIAIYNSRMQANKRREREHMVALKAVEEKNHMKRVLTNNISHELKTPIGIIKAYVEMLVTQEDMPEQDRRHFLLKTQENVDRITSMLNDLSTMTRLEESAETIPLKEVDFHDLVFNFAEEMRATNLVGDMEFDFDIPVNCIVKGNEGLLLSVLNNLVKNARAYSHGTRMGIELFGRKEKCYTFMFYDNGIGVAPEHLPHLFDRFYRIDSGRSRKTGGTGLGLPIVKSSINSMGGGISVRNRRGGGLEFLFTLTRVIPEQQGEADSAPKA